MTVEFGRTVPYSEVKMPRDTFRRGQPPRRPQATKETGLQALNVRVSVPVHQFIRGSALRTVRSQAGMLEVVIRDYMQRHPDEVQAAEDALDEMATTAA